MGQLNLLIILLVLAGSPLIFFLQSPRVALRNYLWLLPFLPDYIVASIGVNMTAMRAATIVLFLAIAYRNLHLFAFRWNAMDIFVAVWIGLYLFAVVPSPPMSEGAVFGAGVLLETIVPYILFRAIIRSTDDIRYLLGQLLYVPYVVLALAFYQSTTGWNIFDPLKEAGVFGIYDAGMVRLGLVRADVGLTHYIMMGLWFAFQIPISIGHLAGSGLDFGRILLRVVHLPVGTFFSLSGGSYLVGLMGIFGYLLHPLRKLWFLGAVLAIAFIAYVEIFSNRGFLRVVAAYSATDAMSAWYRTQLPDAVFEKMPDHWIWGYGRHKPEMGFFNDITNNYLFYLLHSGLMGVFSFMACFLVAYNRLYRCAQAAVSQYLRLLSWGVGISLLALMFGLITVTLFGQMHTYLVLLFALSACMHQAAQDERYAYGMLAYQIAHLGPLMQAAPGQEIQIQGVLGQESPDD